MLRAAQLVVDEGLARPLLVGRSEMIAERIARYGLHLTLDRDFECVNLPDPAVYRDAGDACYQLNPAPRRLAGDGALGDAQPRHAAWRDAFSVMVTTSRAPPP